MDVLCATRAAGSVNAQDSQNLRVKKVQSLRQWETQEFLTYSGLESIDVRRSQTESSQEGKAKGEDEGPGVKVCRSFVGFRCDVEETLQVARRDNSLAGGLSRGRQGWP